MASFGKIARNAAHAMEIPFAPVGGGLFGYLIDQHFGTGPLWTLVFGALGLVHSVITLIRLAKIKSVAA